jgi:hypothetical protein
LWGPWLGKYYPAYQLGVGSLKGLLSGYAAVSFASWAFPPLRPVALRARLLRKERTIERIVPEKIYITLP